MKLCRSTRRGLAAALVVAVTGLGALAADPSGRGPSHTQASPAARKVLAYLQSLRGERTLAGHHVMYGGKKEQELAFIVETTGRHPAILEFEAGIFAAKFQPEYSDQVDRLVRDAGAWWRDGGLVAMCWHWGNPLEPRNTYPNTKVRFDIGKALTEGTPENAALLKDLDVTAAMLARLRDAGVPVLWRPLHEMCGGWFWWSMQGRETAQRLWRFVHERYTRHHRLDNLLWVYSASHDLRTDWYPGGGTVDIVGVDIYRQGQQGRRANYDRLADVAEGRPIALSECDVLPDPDAMREQGFLWAWITTWHSEWVRKNSPETLRRFYAHDRVVTRDELPRFQ